MGGRSVALNVDQVLNRERDAVQRRQREARPPSPIRELRGSKRAFSRQGDEGMEMIIRLLNPLEEVCYIIDRTKCATSESRARRGRAHIRIRAPAEHAYACRDTAPARNGRKKARISSVSSSGTSHAAKCPPRGRVDQCTILNARSAQLRGGIGSSLGRWTMPQGGVMRWPGFKCSGCSLDTLAAP